MTLENEKVEVGVRECSLGVGQALLTVYECWLCCGAGAEVELRTKALR